MDDEAPIDAFDAAVIAVRDLFDLVAAQLAPAPKMDGDPAA